MSGETKLSNLLASMTPTLRDGTYVFATLNNRTLCKELRPLMVFEEVEGTTVVLLQEEAEAHGLPHEFPCRMITLDVHSSLDAVGFMAKMATALAEQGMGVNPVSGFFHDHLFVPNGREIEALATLHRLAAQNGREVT